MFGSPRRRSAMFSPIIAACWAGIPWSRQDLLRSGSVRSRRPLTSRIARSSLLRILLRMASLRFLQVPSGGWPPALLECPLDQTSITPIAATIGWCEGSGGAGRGPATWSSTLPLSPTARRSGPGLEPHEPRQGGAVGGAVIVKVSPAPGSTANSAPSMPSPVMASRTTKGTVPPASRIRLCAASLIVSPGSATNGPQAVSRGSRSETRP